MSTPSEEDPLDEILGSLDFDDLSQSNIDHLPVNTLNEKQSIHFVPIDSVNVATDIISDSGINFHDIPLDTKRRSLTTTETDSYAKSGQICLDFESSEDEMEYSEQSYPSHSFIQRSISPQSILIKPKKRDRKHTVIKQTVIKEISSYYPKQIDICLFTWHPLTICNHQSEELSEYLQSTLPDSMEVEHSLHTTLSSTLATMRYAYYSSINQLDSFDGCKIFQIVAYCINPKRDKHEYPELVSSLYPKDNDRDYILLETQSKNNYIDIGKGEWLTGAEFAKILNAKQANIECVIVMSPQHQRLTQIFSSLGYKYIIGIEAPNNEQTFERTESAAFLDQFYRAIIDKQSIKRAYDLSLNAIGANEQNPKYLLSIDGTIDHNVRFVLFDSIKYGQMIYKSERMKVNKYLRNAVRPFIDRSGFVLSLLNNMANYQIINVFHAKSLIGRASVVKTCVRYLIQRGLFKGGCFVIDCQLSKLDNYTFDQYADGILKSALDMNKPFCLAILNISCWHDGDQEVVEWITKIGSNLLLQHTDSRILCTHTKSMNITAAVSVLNMGNLKGFDAQKLSKLFKYFCRDFKFNLSIQQIENHKALQNIFDGRPGMAQRVSQYARYLVAKNAMSEHETQSINLDFIASTFEQNSLLKREAISPSFYQVDKDHSRLSPSRIFDDESKYMDSEYVPITPQQSPSSFINTLSSSPSTNSINVSQCNYFALNQSAKHLNDGFLSRNVSKEYQMASLGMELINNTYTVQHDYHLGISNPASPLLFQQIEEGDFVSRNQRRQSIQIEQSMTAKASSPQFGPQSNEDAIEEKMHQIMDKLEIAEHARLSMMTLTEHKKLQMILEFDFMEKSKMLSQKDKKRDSKWSIFSK